MSEISQGVVRLLFGDGKIAHPQLKWDIERVTGPDPDFVTRCILHGRTWLKLEPDEQRRFRNAQQFNVARSTTMQALRGGLKHIKPKLIDIRSRPIEQRSFTPTEAANLLHIPLSRFVEMTHMAPDSFVRGDKALTAQLVAHHKPKKPMLIDVLLNAPVTIPEAMDLITLHWPRWSPERQGFMMLWSRQEMLEHGFSRAVWSRHKRGVCDDLNISPPKRVRCVLRWPDMWAWRGYVCGQGLNECYRSRASLLEQIGTAQVELDQLAELVENTLDNLW